MGSKVHELGKVVIKKEVVGCSTEEFQTWIQNNEIVNNFIGWVEVEPTVLQDNVPDNFPNSTIVEYDEEGNIISEESKTFVDYVGGLFHESKNEGKILIPVGERNEYGDRMKPVLNDELRLWVDYFGLDIVKTKSEGRNLIKEEVGDAV